MADNTANQSNKLIWLMAFCMVVLSALTVVNLVLLLEGREVEEVAEVEDEHVEPLIPIFVKIGPMTVNLKTDGYGQRLLYAGLSLRVRDLETQEQLATHMPEVHSRLLVLLSDRSASELTEPRGKEHLAADIMALFEKPLAPGWPEPLIDAVLFTDFIVQ